MDNRVNENEAGVVAVPEGSIKPLLSEATVSSLAVDADVGQDVSGLLAISNEIREGLAVYEHVSTIIFDESGAVFETDSEADSKIIADAIAFIKNPTENFAEIMSHTTNVGSILGDYYMRGEDVPPVIDEMHGHLFALQCINRINFIKRELESGYPNLSEVQAAMIKALDDAMTLAKGYKDNSLLDEVTELKRKLLRKYSVLS